MPPTIIPCLNRGLDTYACIGEIFDFQIDCQTKQSNIVYKIPTDGNHSDVNLAIYQLATSAISARTYPGLIGIPGSLGSGLRVDPLVILH